MANDNEKPKVIFCPPEVGDRVLALAMAMNPEAAEELGLVMILVAKDWSPAIISSIAPNQLPDVYKWLLDNHGDSVIFAEPGETIQ